MAIATGCSTTTTGTPNPAEESTSRSTEDEPVSPTSTSARENSPLADTDPCDLLPPGALTRLGVTSGADSGKVSRGRYCQWDIEKDSIADPLTFSVVIYDTLSTGDIVAKGTPQPIADIGRHKAIQYTGVADNCAISLAITDSSRVDTQVSGSTMEQRCAFILDVAKLVEPELP